VAKKRWIVTDEIDVSTHQVINPALDFWGDNAVLAIGKRIEVHKETEDGSESKIEPQEAALCVTGKKDHFYSHYTELSKRKLFHMGHVNAPVDRWGAADLKDFLNDKTLTPEINLAIIFTEIRKMFEDYYVFTDESHYNFFACYVIYSYFFPIWGAAPVVELWGRASSGKTKIMSLLGGMGFNALHITDITNSSLFRLIDGRRSLILLDEGEDIGRSEDGKKLENQLLAGHTKGAMVYRSEKQGDQSFQPTPFDIFGPKVVASINGIEGEAAKTWTIRIFTSKASVKDDRGNKVLHTPEAEAICAPIRNSLYRLCLTRFQEVRTISEGLTDTGLSQRNLDVWKGILTIAKWISPEVYEDVLSLAHKKSTEMADEIEETSVVSILTGELIRFRKQVDVGWSPIAAIYKFLGGKIGDEFVSERTLGRRISALGIPTERKYMKEKGTGVKGRTLILKDLENKL